MSRFLKHARTMSIFVAIIGMILSGGCQTFMKGVVQEPMPPALDMEHLQNVHSIIEQAIKDKVTPGAVLIIGTPEKTLVRRAYGTMTYDAGSPEMKMDTIFGMASVTKVVCTATAAILLIQDGRLALDDRVSGYIPYFDTEEKRDITIYHLMTHTSGLAPYCSVSKVKEAADPNLPAHENLIRYIADLSLRYKTGKGYSYSCLNYLTLAYINQKILGFSQDILLKEQVYFPLGMKDTTYYLSDEQKKRTAPTIGTANEFRQGEVHDPLAHYSVSDEYAPGNAGLFTTALDLEHYARMILNKGEYMGRRIINEELIEKMTTPQNPEGVDNKRALGFGISETYPWATSLNQRPGQEVASHSGYTGTYLRIDKYAQNYLILLTNRVYPDDSAKVTPLRKAVISTLVESSPLYKDVVQEHEEEE